ncbi:MAG: ABC transporter ATP-binding protein [Bacteriovoracaceae bacterium]
MEAKTSILKLEHVQFSYESSKPIIDIETLKLSQGERVFLHGPSGTGKSTLLNLICGVLDPLSGNITFNQQNLGTLSSSNRDKLRGSELGVIYQSFNLISYLSPLENILLPARLHRRGDFKSLESKADDLLEKMNLNEVKDQPSSTLSMGQQQRVAAARALILSPKLIVADEPTSSLDQKNTELFMEQLFLCDPKTTILFVSHDQSLEKYFQKSYSLEEINRGRKS